MLLAKNIFSLCEKKNFEKFKAVDGYRAVLTEISRVTLAVIPSVQVDTPTVCCVTRVGAGLADVHTVQTCVTWGGGGEEEERSIA